MSRHTATHCHCGSHRDGSDHCPFCGCEEFETVCEAVHPSVEQEPDADCQCRAHWNSAVFSAEVAEFETD